ncbi:MAG: DinB family protein [Polyangiaceae bacterium]|nr:DinB family protein [Polyangiaceae bacterium]
MQEIFSLLAEYNASANGILLGLLEKAPPELVTKDAGSWFGSILGVLNHILRSDLTYLARVRTSRPEFTSLAAPAAAHDPATAPKQLYANLADLAKRRRQVDQVLTAFAAELTDDALKREIRYTNPKGEAECFAVWEVLTQLFNHQAHHRGQVSQILDAAKIEHDFSGVTPVVRARRARR